MRQPVIDHHETHAQTWCLLKPWRIALVVLYAIRIDIQFSHCLLLLDAASSISLKRRVAIRLYSIMKQHIRSASILYLLAGYPG